ncbi:MAG: ergothioneine biosynthesis glutamate--cysteine ligase EgtA, partial [Ilumatobacter sp.]|nr:ergothioneine biosynthesis glutamate--cysteine ligase EgtA [Ilumatobacter sp.]
MNGQHATLADVAARADAAFTPSAEVRIGAEVEWLVFDRSDLTRRIDASDAARTASGELPAGGTVTIEPGGQVELVTPPHDGPRSLIDAIESDTAALANRFAEHDLALVPLGLDPIRDPVRTLEVERYKAMERHFLDVSPAGVQMMNLTASLQLNIDFGPDPVQTWQRAHAIAPLLAAAFVNSPTTDGTEFQPISHRMRIWAATDPTRTRPADPDP